MTVTPAIGGDHAAAAQDVEPSSPPADTPPAIAQTPALAEPAPLQQVAAVPDPTIALAQPVNGAATLVDAAHAAPSAPAASQPAAGPPAVQRITFGQGEGAQPAPEYPREAVLAHQQGAVEITFDVDDTGRVTQATVSNASPFPLLNQAALRAVRDHWRLPPGDLRRRVVTIDFQLKSQ